MNRLVIFRRVATLLFLMLTSVNLWGQDPTPAALSGSGTENNPWQISTPAEWNAFAAAVNGGYSYSGEFVKLTENIGTAADPVTQMVGDLVGVVYYSFKGTFDGDNKTLTFHYNYTELSSSQRLNRVAPFRYINGATIKNLRVAGDINMDLPNAGGLFCVNDIYNDSRSNIINCTVSVNITGYKDYCGGFAAVASNTTFTRCVYNGRLNIGRYSGGFSAQGNKKTIIDNCLCAPTAGSEIYSRSGNFVNEKNAVITNSYYTLLPNPDYSILTQGTRAYTSAPAVFTHYRPLIDGNYYYVEGNATIINLPDGYDYTGSEIPVIRAMTFEGTELTEGTDFIASFSPSPVLPEGTYTMTLNGNNSNYYYGSISRTFEVIDGYLQGEGTAEDPYLIEHAHDWEVFTHKISLGIDVDKYYKLNKNLSIGTQEPITTIIGTTDHPFSGHFDGGFHTLTVNINRTADYAAPFGVIYGATIENLAVEGTITSTKKYLAGIAAMANYLGSEERTNNITNCISSVNIYCNATENSGDCSTGGLLGQNEKGIMNFTNCIFNGTINGNSSGTTQKCGGFVNYNGGTINYNYCTMAGQIIKVSTNKATFNRNTAGNFVDGTISYYCIDYGGIPGSNTRVQQAPTDNTGLGICRKYTFNKTTYYVPGGIISGLEITTFTYTGSVIPVDPVITYYGWTLAKGTDYTVGLTYSETEEGDYSSIDNIQTAGYYKMTITGINNYGGSKVYTIHVVDVITSWLALKNALKDASGTISVYRDLSDVSNDGALVVSGNMVLDLNGHTLNRNRTEEEEADGCVFKVGSDASLKIINGTITGGWNSGSGGGIYSEGDLTLNDVVVVNNKCTATGGGIYCKTGSFNMTGGGIIRNQTTVNGSAAGGGGIYADLVAAFEMNNVTVTENSTISKGGGIRLHINTADTYYINNCTITKNTSSVHSESKGGGIYFDSDYGIGSLNVSGGLICVNTVDKEGGGVYVNHGKVSIQDCNLMGNIVSNGIGGAISVHGNNQNKLNINGCGINGNSSKNQGGGVYVGDGATIEIQGELRIIGNESKDKESNNLYLAKSDEVIKVVGSLPGAVIGVSRSGAGTLTSGLAGYGTIGNFISECSTKVVLPVGGEAYLQNYYTWGVTPGWPVLAGVTKDDENYTFNAIVIIPNGTTVTPSKLVVESGGIVVADGGQLVYTNTSFPVSAKVQKSIAAADSKDDVYGWYTIASPVNEPNITGATNLITMNGENPTYDLLMYDEPNHYWRNYRSETTSTYFDGKLTNGRGYLYRNANDVTAEFNGLIHSGNVTYSVTNSGGLLPGFNLIGNPFTHNITFGNISLSAGAALTGGYVLDKAGSWGAKLAADATISPCQGVLVQVSESATATISHTASGAKANKDFISFTVANGTYEDVAYALFDEGCGLSKIEHKNQDIPMVYINKDAEDFAIATLSDEVKQFNLNFEAKTTGQYTLKVEKTGAYSYLHLIDKVAEKDIDLLEENEYSFVGSPADNADRFIVRLEYSEDAENSVFAYQSGNEIVVSGEGELQVFDVMGRLVMQKHVSGVELIATPMTTGVYILRLNDKTQKIIIK